MSYNSATDFIGLLRLVGSGVRSERMPGLDYVVAALARAGFINLSIGQTAPTVNQTTTAWFQPAIPSWATEGVLFLWDDISSTYKQATPGLWNSLIGQIGNGISVAMQPVCNAATLPIAIGLLGVSAAMQPVVGAASISAALNLLGADTAPVTSDYRQIYNYAPVFDLAFGQFSANMVFDATGIAVAANKTFNFISIRQTDRSTDTFTIGAGGIGNGVWVDLESSAGSDATSNLYAGVFHVTNSGPGTAKGIHADAVGKGASAGVLVAVNAEIQPVATTGVGSSCVQLSLIANPGTPDGVVIGIQPISAAASGVGQGALFEYVIGTVIQPIPVNVAFYQAWMATASAANARAFTTWNNAGTEIQYIKKTGEVVSSTGLIAGTEANGITITDAAITRTAAAGTLSIAAGTSSNMTLQAQGGTVMTLGAGTMQLNNSASFSANASVATALGSVGPAGSHTSPQTWLTIIDSAGATRYIPCF